MVVFASEPSDWSMMSARCKRCFWLFLMKLFVCLFVVVLLLLFVWLWRGSTEQHETLSLFLLWRCCFFPFFQPFISSSHSSVFCSFVDSRLLYVDWQIFWPNRVFRAVCLFCLFLLDFLSEDDRLSSRTMPSGSAGVFNGALSLASVCYSVTAEKNNNQWRCLFVFQFWSECSSQCIMVI